MGWLWSSSPNREGGATTDNADTPASKRDSSWGLSEEQRRRIFGKSTALQENDESRDQASDKELEAFLNSLSSSDQDATKTAPSPVPENANPPTRPEIHDRILPNGSLNIHPSVIHPRTMSCRQAFDAAFYCQSLGGKFNDIYRFGHLQSCSEHWGAFWFCMRTKSLPQQERETQIRDYYAAREERKRREFGSSETVWDLRETAVKRAFWKDPDVDDETERSLKGKE